MTGAPWIDPLSFLGASISSSFSSGLLDSIRFGILVLSSLLLLGFPLNWTLCIGASPLRWDMDFIMHDHS